MVKFIILVLFIVLSSVVFGQEQVVVSTAVPFLNITPDARGGGVAETGVAGRPDVYSMYYNASRYAFVKGRGGVAFSYLPWMRHLIKGQNLFAINGCYRLDDLQTIAAGIRYLKGDDFAGTGATGESAGSFSPSDYVLEAAYSRRFGRCFSAALTFKYIRTGLGELKMPDADGCEPSGAVAFDISCFYQKKMDDIWLSVWRVGVNISNIGSKIAYMTVGKEAYLPANLRLGGAYEMRVNYWHRVSVSLDINKLMVRTYDPDKKDESVLKNIAGSFGNEKFLKSIVWQLGAEYEWRELLAVRAGYFHESEMYGYRQYLTLGGGVARKGFTLDASYLFPTGEKGAPYKNTFRLSLGYCFK